MEKVMEHRQKLKRELIRFGISLGCALLLGFLLLNLTSSAQPLFTVNLGEGETAQNSFGPLEMLFALTILALAPSILILMTSFTRIVIVLSFLRSALGTQQSPPNQVLVGMALFLSLYIMSPVVQEINTNAYQPYKDGALTREEALDQAIVPMKKFMLAQMKDEDLKLFLDLSKTEERVDVDSIQSREDLLEISMSVIIPAFITSELKRAFLIGFLIFLPFLIIDMVVSSTLMSMGMVMLPPTTIALPFKIMMFVIVDGWSLLFTSLIEGFQAF